MIKSTIKISILLTFLVFVLSVDVSGRPLFYHIYEFISPATRYAQKSTGGFLEKSLDTTRAYSKKLFDNSVPKLKDSVKSKLSSRNRNGGEGEPAERITETERSELESLIKNH